MTEDPDRHDEQGEGDWGETDLDSHERLEALVNLDDPSAGPDEPWSPPDRMPRGSEFIGVDTGEGESLDQRLTQEQSESGTAYGRPGASEETREMLGGDDPDAIPADRDVLGDPEGLTGSDAFQSDGSGPEDAAMHLEADRPDDEDADSGP